MSTSLRCVRLGAIVLLIAAICSGNAGESQAQNTVKTGAQSEITGHWAAPDCANTQEALSFTRHFYLKSAPDRLELGRFAQRGTGADHLILTMNGTTTTVMRQEDGVLRTGIPHATPDRKTEWDSLTFDQPRDYTNCPSVPPIIPKPLQRVMRFIDRIDNGCALIGKASTAAPRNLSQDCARVVFKAMDDNGDGKLSLAELKIGIASATLLGALAQDTVLDAGGIEHAAIKARDVAAIAVDIMQAQDKNGDNALDYNEAVTPAETLDLAALKEEVRKIGAFFPIFKLAAQ